MQLTRRNPPKQLELALLPRTSGRSSPARPAWAMREDPAVYEAVMTLRATGLRVFRSGNRGQHQVDGKLLTMRQLLQLAAALHSRKGQA